MSYSTLISAWCSVVSWHQEPPMLTAKWRSKQAPAPWNRLQAKKRSCSHWKGGRHALKGSEWGWDANTCFPRTLQHPLASLTNTFSGACSPDTQGLTHISQPCNQKTMSRRAMHHFQAKVFMSQEATLPPSLLYRRNPKAICSIPDPGIHTRKGADPEGWGTHGQLLKKEKETSMLSPRNFQLSLLLLHSLTEPI